MAHPPIGVFRGPDSGEERKRHPATTAAGIAGLLALAPSAGAIAFVTIIEPAAGLATGHARLYTVVPMNDKWKAQNFAKAAGRGVSAAATLAPPPAAIWLASALLSVGGRAGWTSADPS